MIVYLLLLDNFSNKIPPGSVVLTSTQTNLDLKFADLGIQLDEYIYISKHPVDQVYVVKGVEDLLCRNECESNTVHFLNNKAYGSFYCKPEVITILSTMYKYDISILGKSNKFYIEYFGDQLDPVKIHTNKMLHIIDRSGLKINVN
jgi:hypothetical protein